MISTPQPATLAEYVEVYALTRGLTKEPRKAMLRRTDRLSVIIERPCTFDDLTDENVNRYLAERLAEKLQPSTVQDDKKCLLALWRAAFEDRYVSHLPGRIRKIKVPLKAPRAWTQADLGQLLATIGGLAGWMRLSRRGVTRTEFWRAIVLAAYYSGLRRGDLLAMTWDDVDEQGITLTMSKTGEVIQCPLPSDAREALAKLRGYGRRPFGDFINPRNLIYQFGRMVQDAGLRGSFKTLRKTGASHVEAAHPGSAKAFLGHKTHGLAYRNYVDPRIVQQLRPLPPSIDFDAGP